MMHIFKQKFKTSFFDSEEWETKPFTSIFTTISDKPYQIQTNEYKLNGNYEVVDQGKKAIVGYNDEKSKLFTEVPIIIYGDHTTIIKYRKTPFIVGGDGVKLITNYSDNNLGYLYYALSFCNIKQEGYKRHYSILKNISLPIPSVKTQERIYSLLSMIDKKIDNYNTYLIKLCELKMSLLQKMFI